MESEQMKRARKMLREHAMKMIEHSFNPEADMRTQVQQMRYCADHIAFVLDHTPPSATTPTPENLDIA